MAPITNTVCSALDFGLCSFLPPSDDKTERMDVVSPGCIEPTSVHLASQESGLYSQSSTEVAMRFKTDLKNIRTFAKLAAALSSVEKITWARLDNDTVRFTVIPDSGSQVWASLSVNLIFDNYHIQSAEANNTINLELPLQPLQRALRSAINSISASIRLMKRDGLPVLALTITTTTSQPAMPPSSGVASTAAARRRGATADPFAADGDAEADQLADDQLETSLLRREHEKIISHDIPVRVLHPDTLDFMQPRVRDADVHIQLPSLLQLKAVSDRFTRLAATASATTSSAGALSAGGPPPRLELAATMFGHLRLRVVTDAGDLTSSWAGLENPELDAAQLQCPLDEHPSTRFREAGPDRWATVRVDGKDWSKVLSVGRLDGRVIACFADDHALILYVYVPHYDDAAEDESVITYYVQSYSA